MKSIPYITPRNSRNSHQREGLLLTLESIANTTITLGVPYIFTSAASRFQLWAAGSAFVLAHQAKTNSTSIPSQLETVSRPFSTSIARYRSRMPPKKKEEEKKVLLGRPGNSLKSGIVSRTPRPLSLYLAQLLTLVGLTGWSRERWQIDSLPSHHKMLFGQSCRKSW